MHTIGLVAGEGIRRQPRRRPDQRAARERARARVRRHRRSAHAGRRLRAGRRRRPGRHGAVRNPAGTCPPASLRSGNPQALARGAARWLHRHRCAGVQLRLARRAASARGSAPCSTSARRCGLGARGGCAGSGEAVDLVLCLLPFEKQVLRRAGVRAEFVGHPLADRSRCEVDRAQRAGAGARPPDGTYRRAAARQPAWRGRAAEPRFRRRPSPGCSRAPAGPRNSSLRSPDAGTRQTFAAALGKRAGVRDRVTLVDGNAQRGDGGERRRAASRPEPRRSRRRLSSARWSSPIA